MMAKRGPWSVWLELLKCFMKVSYTIKITGLYLCFTVKNDYYYICLRMQRTKHFYTLCFREMLQYSSEVVAEGKLSTHCAHLLCEAHTGDGDRDQQTHQQQWRDPDALPGRVETCESTDWTCCSNFDLPQFCFYEMICLFVFFYRRSVTCTAWSRLWRLCLVKFLLCVCVFTQKIVSIVSYILFIYV